MIVKERLAEIEGLVLGAGSHRSWAEGACVLEAVSYIAGEDWTDTPECACPVIGAFMRRWNDDLDDAGRQKLKPYITRLVGSRSTKNVEQRRGWLAADWFVRVHTPAWLELAGLKDQADALRSLPELQDLAALQNAQKTIEQAGAAAALSRAAVRAAVGAAVGAAARAAARDAAWDAAWAAAGDAAGDAASKKLEPTKLSLQASAMDLLDRMLAVKDGAA